MFIGGQPVLTKDMEEIEKLLLALPSGFSKRARGDRPIPYWPEGEAYFYDRAGMKAYADWKKTKDEITLKQAQDFFGRAVAAASLEDNQEALMNDLNHYGMVSCLLGQNEKAARAMEAVAAYYEKKKDFGRLYDCLGYYYVAAHQEVLTRRNKVSFATLAEMRKKLKELRLRTLYAATRPYGEPTNVWARRVEQGEVGFSAIEPMGTDNVNDCLCLMVQDPVSNKTALAHIDALIAPESFQKILDGLPFAGTPEKPLVARLLGARFGAGQGHSVHRMAQAAGNLTKVVSFLWDKNVDILSADILNAKQPLSVVVHPNGFEMSEEVPGAVNPNETLCRALPLLTQFERPLAVAFDCAEKRGRGPVYLNRDQVWVLQQYVKSKTEDDLFLRARDSGDYPKTQIPCAVEFIMTLREAYQKATAPVLRALDQTIRKLEKEELWVLPPLREKVEAELLTAPLFVGHGAAAANKPLVDFVRKDLFTVTPKGVFKTNFEGLAAFEGGQEAESERPRRRTESRSKASLAI